MVSPADIMLIMAHPDDAEFGAAGSVALWTNAGQDVVYVVCTRGEKGTTDPEIRPGQLAAEREKEQRDAAEVLGVRRVEFMDYPDQGLEDTAEFRKQIVRAIRKYRPRTVVTSDPYRRYVWHRDHRITGQVVLDAVYPYARDHLAYPDLMEEGLPPHKVREVLFWGAENPNYVLDITGTFDRKVKALHCHKSQIREMRDKNIDTWLRDFCRKMAEGRDFELAEAFYRAEVPE